ncbi:hypothetical protein MIR68_002761 [Amoeboaphelidium protococcarum]|nr:hypothetical protein MIR68_002761 [Amoeboaphelidium protococcarum]
MSTKIMVGELLKLLNLLKPIPQDLIDQLNKNPDATINIWRRRNKDDWLRRRPHDGFDIYNFFRSEYRSLAVYALPPLGDRWACDTQSATRTQSVYSIDIVSKIGEFGILHEFKRDKLNRDAVSLLWGEAKSSQLRPWSGQRAIQAYLRATVIDCLELSGLDSILDVDYETTFSISRIMSKHSHHVDVVSLLSGNNNIASICEVKIPGSSMDSLFSVVDYMVDLRNSFNVRFVFGITTTYEKWRILWFEDTNEAAQETDRQKYDELCSSAMMTTNDYSISSGKVTVYASRVYDHSEVDLVEALVSLLYKVSKTPIVPFQSFLQTQRKYILATQDSFTYESLPQSLTSFSYKFPSCQYNNFYILKYYHRGGDGRVALCCTSRGHLCVVKFPFERENQLQELQQEADLWNRVWDTKCRVVVLNGKYALLMPFCFHIRFVSQQPTFCGLSGWNRRPSSMSAVLDDREVDEFPYLNREQFDAFQKDPMLVAKEALSIMLQYKVKHDDLKWSHVALLPKFSARSRTVEFMPVLIDLTRTSPLTQEEDAPALLNQFETDLKEELDQIIKQLEYNKKFA